MDKIQEAQKLVDTILDSACICQVGKDKAALKDEPEDVKKSRDDIEKSMSMEESVKDIANVKDSLFDKKERMTKEKTDKSTHPNPEPVAETVGDKIKKVFSSPDENGETDDIEDEDEKEDLDESWLSNLQAWGKKKMTAKGKALHKGNKKGNSLQKKFAALNQASG